MGRMIEFTRPDGQKAPGYLAEAGAQAPAVVVIEEWWGLNDQIKGVADRLAQAGFTALAPDLFRGRVTTQPDEASHLMQSLDFQDAATQDVRGAARFLKEHGAAKTAVMGFCMGGALTLLAAAKDPEFDAAVCFYGVPPPQAADLSHIKIPVLFHVAEHDDWINASVVSQAEKAFHKGKVPYELHRYDAHHGFFNETSPIHHYDRTAAEQAWKRTVPFLQDRLQAR